MQKWAWFDTKWAWSQKFVRASRAIVYSPPNLQHLPTPMKDQEKVIAGSKMIIAAASQVAREL